ncbi:MAG: DUF3810 domain-containing protein [Rikenellaceae bacterium]
MVKRILTIEVITIAIIILLQQFAGEWYSQNIYPIVSSVSSFFGSIFPFSIGDLMIVTLISTLIILFFIFKIPFLKRLAIFTIAILALFIWFYVSWGLNYYRHDIYVRTQTEHKNCSKEEFKIFAEGFVNCMNTAFKNYNPHHMPDYKEEIIEAYEEISPRFSLINPPKNGFKPMISSALMMKFGVSGYFNPFFGEYHINKELFDVSKPFTFAHEAAHRAGVTSEAEANLMAYLVCSNSYNQNIRFSGYYGVLPHILSSVYSTLGEEALKELVARINPKIITLRRHERAHYSAMYSKTLGSVQGYVYDKFLKANNISSGSGSYGEVVGLLLDFSY